MTEIEKFKTSIWAYHRLHRRALPWRDHISPYGVFVSEVMLQQTQVPRVLTKYESFMSVFPSFQELARASFENVLALWKGLGYNRRALSLKNAAAAIVRDHGGELPKNPDVLIMLPGIGNATANSIAAFAFNTPTVFIETNIRTVFIHAFFAACDSVHDRDILPKVAATVDHESPREWYYALMDYGVMLKKTVGNKSVKSAHHHHQKPFKGSDRQIRGRILEALLKNKHIERDHLIELMAEDGVRVEKILGKLESEKLIATWGSVVRIA